MRGGDGYIHEVPVNWVEYIPVQRETAMVVGVVEPSTGEPGSANESLPATWQNVLQSNGLKQWQRHKTCSIPNNQSASTITQTKRLQN